MPRWIDCAVRVFHCFDYKTRGTKITPSIDCRFNMAPANRNRKKKLKKKTASSIRPEHATFCSCCVAMPSPSWEIKPAHATPAGVMAQTLTASDLLMLCFCLTMPLLSIVRGQLSCFTILSATQKSGHNPEAQIYPEPFQWGRLCQLWLNTEKNNQAE